MRGALSPNLGVIVWGLLDQSFSNTSKHTTPPTPTPTGPGIVLKGDSDSAGRRWAPDSAPLAASWAVLTLRGQCPRSVANRAQDPESLSWPRRQQAGVFHTWMPASRRLYVFLLRSERDVLGVCLKPQAGEELTQFLKKQRLQREEQTVCLHHRDCVRTLAPWLSSVALGKLRAFSGSQLPACTPEVPPGGGDAA